MLQIPSSIWKIDAKCFQRYRPVKKEDKDSGKNKPADSPYTDVPSGNTFNNLLPTRARPVKKTKTTKEVFGAGAGKNKVALTNLLKQVLISFLRRKKKTSSILNSSTLKKDHFANECPQKRNKKSKDQRQS